MTDTKKKNTNLSKARKDKNNEFYTQLSDIENEVKHYKSYFKDKIVYCNCDDYEKSSFFEYFSINFKMLGLKKLITTCYKSKDSDEPSKNDSKHAVCLEYFGNTFKYTKLQGDGDFRSKECIELLKQADIVVTNPPFSLFREFVAQLIEYDKKFLIVGGQIKVCCKEIFHLIKNNKLWLGYEDGAMTFKVPDSYTGTCNGEPGDKKATLGNICWYTNLDIDKHNLGISLSKNYTIQDYPKYDNYDAINVNKLKDIPKDYNGVMGVPITILGRYNPEQFEILGLMGTDELNEGIRYKDTPHGRPLIAGKEIYTRILIKKVK